MNKKGLRLRTLVGCLLRELTREFGVATSSADYRDAYERMSAALIKLNRQTAYALCSVTPARTGKIQYWGR